MGAIDRSAKCVRCPLLLLLLLPPPSASSSVFADVVALLLRLLLPPLPPFSPFASASGLSGRCGSPGRRGGGKRASQAGRGGPLLARRRSQAASQPPCWPLCPVTVPPASNLIGKNAKTKGQLRKRVNLTTTVPWSQPPSNRHS